MKTECLYYNAPDLSEFSARVVSVKEAEQGSLIQLDRTAFYAEGGGQPADQGTLNGFPVLRVFEKDGVIWHEIPAVLKDEDTVDGVVDMVMREDYSVQHTGQHILSQAFLQLFGAETSSFHLSPQTVSIDLSSKDLSWQDALQAEALANSIVRKALSVIVQLYDERSELPEAVRKLPTVQGPIRLVDVDGFDLCPCGGTHVGNTAQLGAIKVLSLERTRGKTRIDFCCGDRVLRDSQLRIESDLTLTGLLSVPFPEHSSVVERLLVSEKEGKREILRLKKTILEQKTRRFEPSARWEHGAYYFISNWQDSIEDAKLFLAMLAGKEPCVALAVINGKPCRLLLTSSTSIDAGALFKQVLPGYGGKGGGVATSAQGAVPETHLGAALAALEECLSKPKE